jgi:hypothetical protein
MAHPHVEQRRLARAAWRRALRGVPEADDSTRLKPLTSISRIMDRLAWHEQEFVVNIDDRASYRAPGIEAPAKA